MKLLSRLFVGCALLVSFSVQGQQTYRSSNSSNLPLKKTSTTNEKKGFDTERLIYGGGLFGGGGNNTIAIGVSPIIGYKLTNFWSAGISLGYKYFFYKNYFPVYNMDWQKYEYYNLNQHIIVPGVWTRLNVFSNIFTHFEFENVITSYKHHESDPFNNYKHISSRVTDNVPCLLLGAGIKQPMSDRASFVIYALYDVLQHSSGNTIQDPNNPNRKISKSPYANTLDFRVGINFGF